MFSDHEELTCSICGKIFMGRRPAEGGCILCPECLSADELSVVNLGDDIPETVNDEFNCTGGGGENGQN